jgi:hypothetical protein
VIRYTYNRQIEPLAPFIDVLLRCPETAKVVENLPAQIDAYVEEPFVLLGRDVLNGHRLLLDGPGLTHEIA